MSRQHRDIERLLGQTLPRERMPEGLAAQTMDFIRQARQQQAEERADEQPAEHSATADNVIPFERARADRPHAQVPQSQTSQAQATQAHAGAARHRRRLPRRRVIQLLAACLVAASLTVGTLAVASETAQVEVGGTSSIELGLNRLGVVVRVDASDPDLDSQAEGLGLVGKSCTEALEIISADADLQQTMADEGMLVINVSSSSDSQQQGVLSQCETASESFSCETTCMASRASLHDEASANGMGAARYSVYLQIAQIDPSVTVEQCQDMSMRQLRDLLAQVQAQATAASDSENGAGSASGSGEGGMDTGAASNSADVSGAADTTDTATSSTADATALSEEAGSGHGMGKGMGGGMGHGAGRGQGNGSGHGGMGMGMGRGNGMGHGSGMGMGAAGQGQADSATRS